MVLDEFNANEGTVSPSLLRVLRIFRIARLLRLVEFAKGIRRLLWALMISLPALFNIGTLLFMVIFIYAIIGMSAFGHVKREGELSDTVNFETFGSALLLLFRLSTGSGWNDIMDALLLEPPDCDPSYMDLPNGNCGSFSAILYLASYIIVVFLVIVNMYIAIILENVNRVQEGGLIITKEHLDSYYQKWAAFVTNGKQYLQVYQVSDFVDYLDEPLKIAKPNEHELVRIGINVRMGYRVQCFDLLRCLVKRLLEKHGESPQAFEEIASKLENHFRRRGVRKKSSISKSRSVSSVSNEVPNNGDCLLTMESFASSGPAIAEKPAKSESLTSSIAPPRKKYGDPFTTAVMLQKAVRKFLDRHSTRGVVTFPMSNGFSNENVRKRYSSPLSSISSEQEIDDIRFAPNYSAGSRSPISNGSARSSINSSGCLSYDPFDSDGDSV